MDILSLVAILKKYRSLESSLIYQRLAALGWKVAELAEAAAVSKGYAYNLILGRDKSTPGRQRIEKALGIPIWTDAIRQEAAQQPSPHPPSQRVGEALQGAQS